MSSIFLLIQAPRGPGCLSEQHRRLRLHAIVLFVALASHLLDDRRRIPMNMAKEKGP